MDFQPGRIIGKLCQKGTVCIAVAKSNVHRGARQCCIGSRFDDESKICLFQRWRIVDIDGHDPGATLLSGADRMRHHIDLCRHRIGAPDDDAVRLGHFARIGATQGPCSHHKTGPGWIGANRTKEAGIAFCMAQPIN